MRRFLAILLLTAGCSAAVSSPESLRPAERGISQISFEHETAVGATTVNRFSEAARFSNAVQWWQAFDQAQAALAAQNVAASGNGGYKNTCNEAGIIQNESKGDPIAMNPSGAAGLYQFMPTTWAGYGGYASAAQAPPEVQRERFIQVWNGGAGWSNWAGGAC